MIEKYKPQICIVCFANFCRSPVAEIILNNLYGDKFNFFSAGIQPLPKAGMDSRSKNFLSSKNYKFSIHSPKKINKNLFKGSDLVYAIDFEILAMLNKTFPNSSSKIKLFKASSKNTFLPDPFRSSQEEYEKVMESIELICKEIGLELSSKMIEKNT